MQILHLKYKISYKLHNHVPKSRKTSKRVNNVTSEWNHKHNLFPHVHVHVFLPCLRFVTEAFLSEKKFIKGATSLQPSLALSGFTLGGSGKTHLKFALFYHNPSTDAHGCILKSYV